MEVGGKAEVWGGADGTMPGSVLGVRDPVCGVRYDSWTDLGVQPVDHSADLGPSAGGRRESYPHWRLSWGRRRLALRRGLGSGTGGVSVV